VQRTLVRLGRRSMHRKEYHHASEGTDRHPSIGVYSRGFYRQMLHAVRDVRSARGDHVVLINCSALFPTSFGTAASRLSQPLR